jgi:hypothetical protein
MHPNMRVLTVDHYGETEAGNLRVTLSAMVIKMVMTQDFIVQGRPVKKTTILFLDDSEPVELNLSSLDAMNIENIVGAYAFE